MVESVSFVLAKGHDQPVRQIWTAPVCARLQVATNVIVAGYLGVPVFTVKMCPVSLASWHQRMTSIVERSVPCGLRSCATSPLSSSSMDSHRS